MSFLHVTKRNISALKKIVAFLKFEEKAVYYVKAVKVKIIFFSSFISPTQDVDAGTRGQSDDSPFR